ncbi:HIT family protein [Mesoplasma photuris]|uniref:HIT family protein n=1 Tax=Mesoplasma photuris TaxID=217731 RepID=UPI0004E1AB93|nr:HIT family protein [Mesoplasma photuris]
MDCLFCKIIAGEIPSYKVYENEYVYAFLDITPDADGHTLIIPKQHSKNLSETNDLYLSEVAKAKKVVAELLTEKLNAKGFNYVSNENEIAHQMVFHYHEHVIPKYVFKEGYSPSKNPTNISDLQTIINKIKE